MVLVSFASRCGISLKIGLKLQAILYAFAATRPLLTDIAWYRLILCCCLMPMPVLDIYCLEAIFPYWNSHIPCMCLPRQGSLVNGTFLPTVEASYRLWKSESYFRNISEILSDNIDVSGPMTDLKRYIKVGSRVFSAYSLIICWYNTG